MTTPQMFAALMAMGCAFGLARADPLRNWHVRGTNAVLAIDDLRAVTWADLLSSQTSSLRQTFSTRQRRTSANAFIA
jgi:hypothetical protein